jgi:hypothetical protein
MPLATMAIAALIPLVEREDEDIRLHCRSDSIIGFGYSKNAGWQPTVFREEISFVVTFEEKAIWIGSEEGGLGPGFVVREAGEETPWSRCKPRGRYLRDTIHCEGGENFEINLVRLKYQSHFWGTYTATEQFGDNGKPDTPWVSIGTCTPF